LAAPESYNQSYNQSYDPPTRRPSSESVRRPALPEAAASAVRRTVGILWRRRWLIGLFALIGTALAVFAAMRMTPLYTGEALVMLENRRTEVIDFEAVLSGITPDLAAMQGEVAILQSSAFAEKVVDKLGLVNDPEFNADLRPPGFSLASWFDPRNWIPRAWLDGLRGRDTAKVALSEEEERERVRNAVVDSLLDRMGVRPQGRSFVMAITVDSEDPRKAARIANTAANLYLVDQLDEKFEATRRATQWLEERLTTMRDETKRAGDAVEAFRAKAGLTTAGESPMLSQQLAELSTRYVVARTERETAEAKFREVAGLAKSSRGPGAIGDVLASPLVQTLRGQEAEVARRVAELSDRYGPRHPDIVAARAQLADVQGRIQGEVSKIVQNLSTEADVARAREEALRQSLDQLRGQVDEQQQAGVVLKTLERDAATTQTMYQTLLERFQETSAQQDIQQADARVVSRAVVPMLPSEPNKKAIALFGLIASGGLGVMLAFLLEHFERGFRSPHQVEALTGVKSFGLVPSVARRAGFGRRRPADYVLDRPLSAFAEAMQSLRTSLLLASGGHLKVVLFGSSVPGEGKSTVAAAFARLSARSGQRVILVDCDLRRKSLHDLLGLANERGLYEVLTGACLPQDAIQEDPRTGLHFMAAGHGAALPQDMLGSTRMQHLATRLAAEYDLVVLDSPPVLAVSEAKLLAALADQTVFIVQWGRTRREVVLDGLKEVMDAGGVVAGVLLTQVDLRKNAQYEFPDSGRYQGGYGRYYVN